MLSLKVKQFEVDIYSKGPLLIFKCTNFLESDELHNVEKLLKMKKYFEMQGENAQYLYFVTYDIYQEVIEKVTNFCHENNIILIKKSDI